MIKVFNKNKRPSKIKTKTIVYFICPRYLKENKIYNKILWKRIKSKMYFSLLKE